MRAKYPVEDGAVSIVQALARHPPGWTRLGGWALARAEKNAP